MRRLMVLSLVEGAAFLAASLVHRGVLIGGYEHERAAIAETMIGVVLQGGGALVSIHPAQARTIALAFQAFAALGTMMGVFTIAIGVGPRTGPDLAYHALILAVLFPGPLIAGRAREYVNSCRRATASRGSAPRRRSPAAPFTGRGASGTSRAARRTHTGSVRRRR